MEDSVAVDAKRILLRYGAPISVLDRIDERDRISFARIVSRTNLAERADRLRELLVEHGYVDGDSGAPPRKRAKKKKVSNE